MSVELVAPRPPGTHFAPNSWAQQRCLVSPTPQLLYSGRYGSSKSRTLCEKADYRARAYPGARIIIARKRRTDLGQTTLHTLLDECITPAERAWGWRISADGGSTLHYANGSRILCVGLDNPGKLRSGEFDLALVDQCEELDEEEWNAILGRLRHRHGPFRQLAGFCNPGDPTHFLYRRFRPQAGSHIERTTEPTRLLDGTIMPAGLAIRECVLSAGADNTENLDHDYQMVLQSYSGRYYDRYVLGKWVAFEGMVYADWDADVHLCGVPQAWERWDNLPPPSWPRVVGIDFGYENPFVAEWFAISPESHWYRYRELFMSNRTIESHAAQMVAADEQELRVLRERAKALNATQDENGYLDALNIVGRYCDHDAGERMLLRDHGVWNEKANKDIEAGLQTLMRMLNPNAPGGTHLHFVRGAGLELDRKLQRDSKPFAVEDEFPGYRWSKRNAGELKDAPKDLPVDRDNHGLDAVRYAVHSHLTRGSAVVY